MPELPEVETTRRTLEAHLLGKKVTKVVVRDARLRWPIPSDIKSLLQGATITSLGRRAKYLLFDTDRGTALVHLGMSGSLRISAPSEAPLDHDHFELELDGGARLRLRDPRRFGAVLWAGSDPFTHPLLNKLGPEPLGNEFSGAMLFHRSRKRKVAIKNFIMNAQVVVGVGNIYASETLHLAGIHPRRAAGRISLNRFETLASCIRDVLSQAIGAGGTTLRDYVQASGETGEFGARLRVYGRSGEACEQCTSPIRQEVIGQRSSFYCVTCQR